MVWFLQTVIEPLRPYLNIHIKITSMIFKSIIVALVGSSFACLVGDTCEAQEVHLDRNNIEERKKMINFEITPGISLGDIRIGDKAPESSPVTTFYSVDGIILSIITKDKRFAYQGVHLIGMSALQIEQTFGKLEIIKDQDQKIRIPMYEIKGGLIIAIIDGIVDHLIIEKVQRVEHRKFPGK